MSVESEILRIQHNIASAYAAVSKKGGQVPLQPTSANLPAAIETISCGGSPGQSSASWAYGYDKNLTVWSAYINILPEKQLVLCEENYEVLEGADE